MQPAPLPKIRFDTAGLPPRQQMDAWREAVGVTHEIAATDPDGPGGLLASSDVWRLGHMVVSYRCFPALRFSRRTGRTRSDGLDHYALLFMRRGTWTGDVEGREVRIGPGEIGVLDLARPVDNLVSANASLRVMLPRDQIEAMLPALPEHGAVLRGNPGTLLADYFRLMQQGLETLDLSQVRHVEQATRSMIAACLAPSPGRREAAASALEATAIQRARAHVEANLCRPGLTPESLARAIGLSRSALYRLFEPAGGVAAFIQSRRLQRIRSRLMNPDERRRISDLAFEHGFVSEVHFARAFRRAFGSSASELRAAARQPSAAPSTPAGQIYSAWVRGG